MEKWLCMYGSIESKLCVWVNVVSHVCEKEMSCGLSRLEVIEGVKELCTVYSVQCSV